MKRSKRTAAALLAALLTLTGCSQTPGLAGTSPETTAPGTAQSETPETTGNDPGEMFTDRDRRTEYDAEKYTEIRLSDGGTEADSTDVKVEGSAVTITGEGGYILTGSLSNGRIVVDADKSEKVHIVLKGAAVNSESSAALYVRQADKVFVTIEAGTENSLSGSGEFIAVDEYNIDGAVFARDDITFNGGGSLKISSANGHGIVAKDDLVFTGGTYQIGAAGHGIQANDSVRIEAGSYTVEAERDGIHCENDEDTEKGFVYIAGGSFDISAGTDGIEAGIYLRIDGGVFGLETGGGSANASTDSGGNRNPGWGNWGGGGGENSASAKGLKSRGDLTIGGGELLIDSSDDAIHSNSSVYINGGSIEISSGDDGIHADSKAVINGGEITVKKSFEGIEGQSIDINAGEIGIVSRDDGLNAAGGADGSGLGDRPGRGGFNPNSDSYIRVSGGSIRIDASGDGIDSNGNLSVSGGEIYISGSLSGGNSALDYDGAAEITGGIVVASGSSGMAQNFSGGTQGSILYNLSGAAGTAITLKDSAGKTLCSHTPEKSYSSVVVSAPGILQGESYTLWAGGQSVEIKMTSLIYGSGGMGGPGGPGGRR